MGEGFSILIWDKYGSGLVMVNPRFISDGVDIYGNPKNWFPYKTKIDFENVVKKLTKGIEHYKIIKS